MMSFNLVGACFVVLIYFSRTRNEKGVRVKEEEKVKGVKVKEEKAVKVKKEEEKEEKQVKVKKEEEKEKAKEQDNDNDNDNDTSNTEKHANNNVKQRESAIKHCDSFFTMLLEGTRLPSFLIVESENLVRRRQGY